jgi:ketosteroid isomerase-like protein
MTTFSASRRTLLGTGVCLLAGGAGAGSPPAMATAAAAPGGTTEAIIRTYYGAWGKRDWGVLDALLAEDFTFSSAAPDDHISKAAFKKQCWDTQSSLIEGFDLERVFASGDEAFVRYVCRTKNGKSFRNVEYHQLKDRRIEVIECYFGGPGYPSAANAEQK